MATINTGTAIIDITVPISDRIPTWPGDPGVSVLPVYQTSEGDPANITSICLGSHTGTHIDPPRHFDENGKSVDEIELERLIGECRVIEVDSMGEITADQISRFLPLETERLLIKTPNSRLWGDSAFYSDFACLSADAAQLVTASGVRLVGIDYLSVEAFGSEGHPVHREFFSNDVIIVEGLDLSEAEPGHYVLSVLPLKVRGGDGAPARAILEQLGP